jgi:hypothetical protein
MGVSQDWLNSCTATQVQPALGRALQGRRSGEVRARLLFAAMVLSRHQPRSADPSDSGRGAEGHGQPLQIVADPVIRRERVRQVPEPPNGDSGTDKGQHDPYRLLAQRHQDHEVETTTGATSDGNSRANGNGSPTTGHRQQS